MDVEFTWYFLLEEVRQHIRVDE